MYVPDVPDVYVPEVAQNFGLGGTAGLMRLCLKESCQGTFMQKRQMVGIYEEKDVLVLGRFKSGPFKEACRWSN